MLFYSPLSPSSIYLPIMETVYKSYFTEWMADSGPPKECVCTRRSLPNEGMLTFRSLAGT